MTQNPDDRVVAPIDDLDDLETNLEGADAADAPAIAEQAAGLLGSALDDIAGGSGGGTP